MSDYSPEEVQALAQDVSMWRLQENIYISFCALYIYYVLTTIQEEVKIIFPQRWNKGKVLFSWIRYGMCIWIMVHLLRDFRNYIYISPKACKGLVIIYGLAIQTVNIASEFVVGLCLCALLHVRLPVYIAIMVLCTGPRVVQFIVLIVADIQFPALPVDSIDIELGYTCYYPSGKKWDRQTIYGVGRDARNYVSLTVAALLLLLATATIFLRYRERRGRLIQVIVRDGGFYYFTSLVIRFGLALFRTPSIVETSKMEGNAAYLIFNNAAQIFTPILAQRLMINMRNVDYLGSQPVASKLLFAPAAAGSTDSDEYQSGDSMQLSEKSTSMRRCGNTDDSGNATLDTGDIREEHRDTRGTV